eukprot:scaffold2.g6937.t1
MSQARLLNQQNGGSPGSPLLAPSAAAPPIESQDSGLWGRAKRAWSRHARLPWGGTGAVEPPPPPSGYLTLIPLSDSRLQPRDTRLTAAFLLAFALLVAGAVFVAVPRGVSVGEISVLTDKVPVFNPNFLHARIAGDLRVLFYRTEAGKTEASERCGVHAVTLPPRAAPHVLDVGIDASDVPSEYILAILSQASFET